MSRKAFISLGVAVIAIVVGGVFLTTGDQSGSPADVGGVATSSESGFVPNLITAAHQYNEDEGVHIVAGEAEIPTPCHLLTYDVSIAESLPEQVSINFASEVDDPDKVCAQVISTQRFKVTFEASEDASISATYNGKDVELNLQEVGPGENLEEFEVYTKG
ncbi:MAG: hypothetical protein WD335_02340 [Candidatus Paceibacterota bacterium]